MGSCLAFDKTKEAALFTWHCQHQIAEHRKRSVGPCVSDRRELQERKGDCFLVFPRHVCLRLATGAQLRRVDRQSEVATADERLRSDTSELTLLHTREAACSAATGMRQQLHYCVNV